MYGDDGFVWRADVKWIAGLLAVVAIAATTVFVSAAQLATPQRGVPLLERILTLTLAPGGTGEGETAAVVPDVRQGLDYEPGDPLVLLPGVSVVADATEVPTIQVEDAIGRMAGVLADRFVTGGTPAVTALIDDPLLSEQFATAFGGPVPVVLDRHLRAALFPAGLDDGTRIADWPLQVQQNPGEPVQPIVGVFVYAEPSTVASLTAREIGELVVSRLADLVLEGGVGAALDVITNPNLATRLEAAVETDTRATIHDTFTALLASQRPRVDARLEQARAILEAQGEPPRGIAGILSPEELAGLSEAERTERVVAALAERAYSDGGAALLPLFEDGDQAERVASVVPLLDSLSRDARGGYLRRAWFSGVLGGLLLAVLLLASRGWGRMINPGFALALAAAGGAGGAYMLARAIGANATAQLPLSVRAEGVFAHLLGLLGYVAVSLPRSAFELLLRNHLAVLVAGGVLIVLALAIRVVRLVRPRRRSLL